MIAEDILRAREERAARQRQWLGLHGSALVSFTLNIPGPEKQSPLFQRVHQAGLNAVLEALPVTARWAAHPPTGSEALLASPWEARRIKALTVALERDHPLGRLFDLDVLAPGGSAVSRIELGFPPRACLVCADEAAVCARSRRHPLPALIGRLEFLAAAYFN